MKPQINADEHRWDRVKHGQFPKISGIAARAKSVSIFEAKFGHISACQYF